MVFVNLSLLIGGSLAAIPVILHLVLRQQPKRIAFPAVLFLKERRETNRRQLQLRHWILLFLRCIAIGLLAAALARPSVASAAVGNWLVVGLMSLLATLSTVLAIYSATQRQGKWLIGGLSAVAATLVVSTLAILVATLAGKSSGVLGDQQAPVSVALVFDTSPRMEYRYNNRTPLEVAKEMSLWLMSQFPTDSHVAVMESRPGPTFFSVDLAAAKSTVERMHATGLPDSLSSVVGRAVELVRTAQESRREVYVFTDMAKSAWSEESLATLKTTLAENSDLLLYVIDVGVEHPRNVSLGELKLSSQTLSKSAELVVSTEVRVQGTGGEFSVELLVEQSDPTRPIVVDGKTLVPNAQVRDRRTVPLPADGSQRVEFRVRGWELGIQQGHVRLTAEDGLAGDNVRYFTVEVREPWPVLLVAPPNVSTFLLSETLSPWEQREVGSARFACTEIKQQDLSNHDLANDAVVCLVDPEPMAPAQWEQLGRYVERGGSLAVFLGPQAQPASFNDPAAQRVLGGKLGRLWRAAGREVFLSPRRFDHPVLAIFRDRESSIPWSDSPVFRFWSLDDLAADTFVVVEFNQGKPAIIERSLGSGHILVAATPLAEESQPEGRAPWNELLTSENAWPQFVLLNELIRYLASGGEHRLNYLTGETATLASDPIRDPQRYQLFTPLDDPQDIVPRDGIVSVPFTEFAGAYRLKGQRGGPIVRGFAVNLPPTSTDLTRLPVANLQESLGKDRFRYARNRDEITLEVGEARVGREFYPFLLFVLVIVLGLEHTLANRFYRNRESDASPPKPGSGRS